MEHVVFFRNDDGTYKGDALRVYHGDAEEYWTHITPEFCNLSNIYKIYRKSMDQMISLLILKPC